jgi:hypothetical protein
LSVKIKSQRIIGKLPSGLNLSEIYLLHPVGNRAIRFCGKIKPKITTEDLFIIDCLGPCLILELTC